MTPLETPTKSLLGKTASCLLRLTPTPTPDATPVRILRLSKHRVRRNAPKRNHKRYTTRTISPLAQTQPTRRRSRGTCACLIRRCLGASSYRPVNSTATPGRLQDHLSYRNIAIQAQRYLSSDIHVLPKDLPRYPLQKPDFEAHRQHASLVHGGGLSGSPSAYYTPSPVIVAPDTGVETHHIQQLWPSTVPTGSSLIRKIPENLSRLSLLIGQISLLRCSSCLFLA